MISISHWVQQTQIQLTQLTQSILWGFDNSLGILQLTYSNRWPTAMSPEGRVTWHLLSAQKPERRVQQSARDKSRTSMASGCLDSHAAAHMQVLQWCTGS